jgi:hypothetical protein
MLENSSSPAPVIVLKYHVNKYLPVMNCFLSVVYSVFFYRSVKSYCCVLLFCFCVLYCLLFLYCTVSACAVRANTLTEGFSVLFPQLQDKCLGTTCKDGARSALPKLVNFFYCYVCLIL